MRKRRDQVRLDCPKCGLSKLLSYYESSLHMRDCRGTLPQRTSKRQLRPARRPR